MNHDMMSNAFKSWPLNQKKPTRHSLFSLSDRRLPLLCHAPTCISHACSTWDDFQAPTETALSCRKMDSASFDRIYQVSSFLHYWRECLIFCIRKSNSQLFLTTSASRKNAAHDSLAVLLDIYHCNKHRLSRWHRCVTISKWCRSLCASLRQPWNIYFSCPTSCWIRAKSLQIRSNSLLHEIRSASVCSYKPVPDDCDL